LPEDTPIAGAVQLAWSDDIIFIMNSEQEYALTVAAEKKRLEKQIGVKKAERSKWEERIRLASGAGRDDLKAAAEKELALLDSEIQQLEVEYAGLLREFEDAKKSWKNESIQGKLSVDAAELARELEAAAGGPPDKTADELNKLAEAAEAENELAALKRAMGLSEGPEATEGQEDEK